MGFIITWHDEAGKVEDSRYQPASAVLLAKRLAASGVRDLRITDHAGRTYDLAAFLRAADRRTARFAPF